METEEEAEEDIPDEMGQRGQILWIRGLSRLQHQVEQSTLFSLVYFLCTSVNYFTVSLDNNCVSWSNLDGTLHWSSCSCLRNSPVDTSVTYLSIIC